MQMYFIKILKNTILLKLLCFSSAFMLSAQNVQYGLAFNSFEVIQEKRTGLNLTPGKPLNLPDGFRMTFDVCFQSDFQRDFGYVFRIISQDEQQHIDFILHITELSVLSSTHGIMAKCNFADIHLEYDKFMTFEITANIKTGKLDILMKDRAFSVEAPSLEKFEQVYIVFGKSDFHQLQVSDVPKMIIKDVRIKNSDNEDIRFWPLSKHTSGGVYDEIKKQFASVENPQWILDKHVFWEKQTSFAVQNNPQITFNADENRIAVSDRERFVIYSTDTHVLNDNQIMKGAPHSNLVNQLIYDPFSKRYYSYHLAFNDGKEVIAYDTVTNVWNNEDKLDQTTDYWHHNRFISPYDSCLYLFNGYGHHRYKSIVNKYDFKRDIWKKNAYTGDTIAPRYLSGLGAFDERRVLIFGGYGNETGTQELSTQHYYDLFMIDVKTMESRKIWELPMPENDFVVSNTMIADTLYHCFYALCFPRQIYHTTLSLYRFSLDKPEYTPLAGEIPYEFEDIYSYSDLYLNRNKTELIAVTSFPVDKTAAEISVYTLYFPPLSEKDLYQEVPETNRPFLISAVLTAILLMLASMYYKMYGRKKRKEVRTSETARQAESLAEPQTGAISGSPSEKKEPLPDKDDSPAKFPHIKPSPRNEKKQSILFFGGFRAIDREGNDITAAFTTVLKHLFLLISLHTLTGRQGISSTKLHECLWWDKPEGSAKNNRSVSLNKLRQIIEKIGNIRIKNRNLIWTVEFGDDIYCDYYEALVLLESMKNNTDQTARNVQRLLFLISRGELLPDVQTEWIDPFKADFSDLLIEIFLEMLQQPAPDVTPQGLIDIADAILIYDSLNEDALQFKCRLLVKTGKNGLAKNVYAAFAKKYSAMLGTPFKHTFEQIIS